jgi:hypothetical protein
MATKTPNPGDPSLYAKAYSAAYERAYDMGKEAAIASRMFEASQAPVGKKKGILEPKLLAPLTKASTVPNKKKPFVDARDVPENKRAQEAYEYGWKHGWESGVDDGENADLTKKKPK